MAVRAWRLRMEAPLEKYLISKPEGLPGVFRIEAVAEWQELATWLFATDRVLYRGQRRPWPLLPSVAREHGLLAAELEILEEFKREAVPYLSRLPVTDWQWLAVAQHNGLPTRLLDWTRNPLVALWFAVEKPAHPGCPGVIWAHWYGPEEIVSDSRQAASPLEADETRVYLPEHVFPSIEAQGGLFTVHVPNGGGDFEAFETSKDADLRFARIDIPEDAFPTIRYHLARVGISHSSLYPGLSGLARRIRYQHSPQSDELETSPQRDARETASRE